MCVRTAVGSTSSVSPSGGQNTPIGAGVLLVRRWRFAPRAEAQSQFSQAAKGGKPRAAQLRLASMWPANVGRMRAMPATPSPQENSHPEQCRSQHAPALRRSAAPTLAAGQQRHRRLGAHAFRVWAASRRADEGRPSVATNPSFISRYSQRRGGQRSRALRAGCCLTPRSSGAPTACHQARSVARYILHSPGLAASRWLPLSSNVRPHKCPNSSSPLDLPPVAARTN